MAQDFAFMSNLKPRCLSLGFFSYRPDERFGNVVGLENDLRLASLPIVPPEAGPEIAKAAQMAKSARRRCTVTRARSPSPVALHRNNRFGGRLRTPLVGAPFLTADRNSSLKRVPCPPPVTPLPQAAAKQFGELFL
jgi:hypothetical protein